LWIREIWIGRANFSCEVAANVARMGRWSVATGCEQNDLFCGGIIFGKDREHGDPPLQLLLRALGPSCCMLSIKFARACSKLKLLPDLVVRQAGAADATTVVGYESRPQRGVAPTAVLIPAATASRLKAIEMHPRP
jgi:hypothetical protein